LGNKLYPYVIIVISLLIFHYLSTLVYYKYCVITYYNFYNIVFSVSPLCSYSLDIITLCQNTFIKIWYIFGGFIIIKITELFGRI